MFVTEKGRKRIIFLIVNDAKKNTFKVTPLCVVNNIDSYFAVTYPTVVTLPLQNGRYHPLPPNRNRARRQP